MSTDALRPPPVPRGLSTAQTDPDCGPKACPVSHAHQGQGERIEEHARWLAKLDRLLMGDTSGDGVLARLARLEEGAKDLGRSLHALERRVEAHGETLHRVDRRGDAILAHLQAREIPPGFWWVCGASAALCAEVLAITQLVPVIGREWAVVAIVSAGAVSLWGWAKCRPKAGP